MNRNQNQNGGNWGQPQQNRAPRQQQQPQQQPQSWGAPAAPQNNQQNPQQPTQGRRGLSRGQARLHLIGNLGKNPNECEIRTVGNNHQCITVPVVVNENDKTSVFLVTFWNGLGQALCENKQKGDALSLTCVATSVQDASGNWHTNFNVNECLYLN